MQVFSTRLPLKDSVSQKECLQIFVNWITQSPHYSINQIDYDISSHKSYEVKNNNVKVNFRHFKDDTVELSACRLENQEPTTVWYIDYIFLNESGKKSLLIQLNCNRLEYNIQLPVIHKPYIVRKIVESKICKDDDSLPIIDESLTVENGYIDSCARVMRGESICMMPVIYISCDYWGNTQISPKYLAHQLSGVAHVFSETDYNTALRLKDMTDGNNVHNGYIGVYFPKTKFCQKYNIEWFRDYKAMSKTIIDDVWSALINRLDSTSYNWNQILALQSRQKMVEWMNISSQDKEQLKQFMDSFDKENKDLQDTIYNLREEKYNLRTQLDLLQAKTLTDNAGICFYKRGLEADLYSCETNDLLYSILSQVKQKYEKGSRAHTIICSLLEANPYTGECAKIIDGIRKVFSDGDGLNKNKKMQLKKLGFIIEEDGKHYKVMFHDARYMFTVSKTPSDYREGKNLVSDISKILNIEKKI